MTVLLNAQGLNKRFGGVVATHDVSISIAPLEIKCIIGANGAGKSTLFNILCGALSPDSGSLTFDGKSLLGLPLHHFARKGIARKFQMPSVFNSLTVAQNLETACRGKIAPRDLRLRVDAMLERTQQSHLRGTLAGNLAHGHKQWLEIGMALMSAPKLLLLDEPTAGMTPEETQNTADLIKALARDTAVMAIEHDMSFVRALGCHTYVMHQGALIVEGHFAEIEKNELVRDVYLGRA
jgi:ABC-type uncharacterized transport system ATPase subunit